MLGLEADWEDLQEGVTRTCSERGIGPDGVLEWRPHHSSLSSIDNIYLFLSSLSFTKGLSRSWSSFQIVSISLLISCRDLSL